MGPNVTGLLCANFKKEDFAFLFSQSRLAQKKKDREKECLKDISTFLDMIPTDKLEGWCQMPPAGTKTADPQAADIEKLKTLVQKKHPKVIIEFPEPTAFVVVAAMN